VNILYLKLSFPLAHLQVKWFKKTREQKDATLAQGLHAKILVRGACANSSLAKQRINNMF
jgi:hypothetical protein